MRKKVKKHKRIAYLVLIISTLLIVLVNTLLDKPLPREVMILSIYGVWLIASVILDRCPYCHKYLGFRNSHRCPNCEREFR
jgi:hypothetical protein